MSAARPIVRQALAALTTGVGATATCSTLCRTRANARLRRLLAVRSWPMILPSIGGGRRARRSCGPACRRLEKDKGGTDRPRIRRRRRKRVRYRGRSREKQNRSRSRSRWAYSLQDRNVRPSRNDAKAARTIASVASIRAAIRSTGGRYPSEPARSERGGSLALPFRPEADQLDLARPIIRDDRTVPRQVASHVACRIIEFAEQAQEPDARGGFFGL
jgi:hypothetical protein